MKGKCWMAAGLSLAVCVESAAYALWNALKTGCFITWFCLLGGSEDWECVCAHLWLCQEVFPVRQRGQQDVAWVVTVVMADEPVWVSCLPRAADAAPASMGDEPSSSQGKRGVCQGPR